MDINGKTYLKKSADFGFLFGLIFTWIFFTGIYSTDIPFLGIVSFITFMMVPGLLYLFLERTDRDSYGTIPFSVLWMEGIILFFCGSLILSILMYLFLRFIDPTFIVDRIQMLIDMLEEQGGTENIQQANNFRLAIKGHIIPSAIEFAIVTIWIVVFTGSLLSMAVAGIVKSGIIKRNRKS